MHQSNYSISLVEYSLISRGGHPTTAASPASAAPGTASGASSAPPGATSVAVAPGAASAAPRAASAAPGAVASVAAFAGGKFSCWADELGTDRARVAWNR